MQKSERILSFVAKMKEEKYAIVGVYGPTEARTTIDEREELQFIEQLQTTIDSQKKNHTLIVFGDFSFKLGSSTDKVVGKYGEGTRKVDNKLTPIYNTTDYIIISEKQKWRLISARLYNGMQTFSDP